MNFSDLPIELKMLIFSYIKQSDLFCKVAYVCKEWNQIAQDPTLFKNVKIDGHIEKGSKISKVLNHTTLVRCVEFGAIHDWSWMKKLSVEHNLLTSIEFLGCTLASNDMAQLVFQFPSVESFNTNFGEMEEDCLKHVSKWKKLKNYRMYFAAFIPGTWKWSKFHFKFPQLDANCFLQIGMWCEFLESFSLIDDVRNPYLLNLNDDFVEAFIHYRKGTLKKLNLLCEKLTSRGFKSISEAHLLTELTIHNPSNTKHLCMQLKNLTQLELLTIQGGKRTSFFEGDFSLLFGHKNFARLSEICIIDCPNFDDSAMSLMIKNCPTLKKLMLYRNLGVSNYGLDSVFRNCNNLETFGAHCKTVSPTGVLGRRDFYWSMGKMIGEIK